jgi:hypothetical protein
METHKGFAATRTRKKYPEIHGYAREKYGWQFHPLVNPF